jgi:hypothetical protein
VKTSLIIRDRREFDDGAILEIVVWHVPVAVPPTTHYLKYRLFYGTSSLRIIGYDNERGKGDHKHSLGVETPYHFTTLAKLLDDFEADVVAIRGERI